MLGERFQSLESPYDCDGDYPVDASLNSQNVFTYEVDQNVKSVNDEGSICKLLLNLIKIVFIVNVIFLNNILKLFYF